MGPADSRHDPRSIDHRRIVSVLPTPPTPRGSSPAPATDEASSSVGSAFASASASVAAASTSASATLADFEASFYPNWFHHITYTFLALFATFVVVCYGMAWYKVRVADRIADERERTAKQLEEGHRTDARSGSGWRRRRRVSVSPFSDASSAWSSFDDSVRSDFESRLSHGATTSRHLRSDGRLCRTERADSESDSRGSSIADPTEPDARASLARATAHSSSGCSSDERMHAHWRRVLIVRAAEENERERERNRIAQRRRARLSR